jgi:hypothetical protein
VLELVNGATEDRTPNPLIERWVDGETDAHQDTSSLWNIDEME